MQDTETDKGGFIITNDNTFLELYARNIQNVEANLAQ